MIQKQHPKGKKGSNVFKAPLLVITLVVIALIGATTYYVVGQPDNSEIVTQNSPFSWIQQQLRPI